MANVIVIGAGINGVTAAIELKKRGRKVILLDPGPLPHPLAASTDISKAVRTAYGADEEMPRLRNAPFHSGVSGTESSALSCITKSASCFCGSSECNPAILNSRV